MLTAALALALALQLNPHGIHLIDAQDAPVETQPAVPLEQMTRQQLHREQNRLEDERPSIALPITALAIGGVCVFGGVLTLLYSGLLSLAIHVDAMVFLVAGVIAAGGGALLAVGIVTLIRTLGERKQYNEQLQQIQDQLDRLNGKDVPHRDDERGPPDAPPPPMLEAPPPPPPAAMWVMPPPPSLVLARF